MKKNPVKKTAQQAEKSVAVKLQEPTKWFDVAYTSSYLLIAAIVFISYGASLFNDFALDDFIVFVQNKFVQQGFSGIGNIFSKDTFAGMTSANIMGLAGGRYRPLSLVTFAIEHQFVGNSPFIAHLINVIIYALSGIFLFNVLRNVFKLNETLALITTVVFIALPVHSEAVINVKGRDDLLCFLFFLLALQQFFNYLQSNKYFALILSLAFYFLSLLSKESAVTYLVLFPLTLYFFSSTSIRKIIAVTTPYLIVALIFLSMRYSATKNNTGSFSDTDVFNKPFAFMNITQHYATVIYTWLLYLKLIFYPVHLSYDYNYNQIPALKFTDVKVLASIAVHLLLITIAVVYFKRKSIYSFGILFYFITFSVFSNLFFDIGAPLAERFMLVPSLGICLLVIKFYFDVLDKYLKSVSEKSLKYIKYGLPIVMIIMSSYRNYVRCADWKNNHSLFIADVNSVPMNSKANLNAGLSYLEMSQLQQSPEREQSYDSAQKYYYRAIEIYPDYADGYLNIGVIYNWKHNYDSAEIWWNKAEVINPHSAKINEYYKVLSAHYFQTGMQKGVEKNYVESINDLLKAYRYDSLNASISYNIGGAYFTINEFAKAKFYWEKTVQLDPSNQKAIGALQAVNQQLMSRN